jgi:glycosyltransferase involved in cell wall biosynthesis
MMAVARIFGKDIKFMTNANVSRRWIMKIIVINDSIYPTSGEKENFWTWLVRELPATPINFTELKISLNDAVKKENPDVIINNSIWGFTFPDYFVISLLQDPYIGLKKIAKPGSLSDSFFNPKIEMQKRALKNSQVRVAVSSYMADSYKDCGNFKIIPIGTDAKLFRPMNKKKMRKKYGIPSDKTVYIYVGSHDVIKGWKEISDEIKLKKAFWILVFKDFEEPEQENIKTFYKITQEQLAELYNCADYYLSNSYVESLGLAPIEAMFCNITVISPSVGIFWDWDSDPMKSPRENAFEKGLDKKICIEAWKELMRNGYK